LPRFSALVVKQLATLGAVDERDLQDRFQLLDADGRDREAPSMP